MADNIDKLAALTLARRKSYSERLVERRRSLAAANITTKTNETTADGSKSKSVSSNDESSQKLTRRYSVAPTRNMSYEHWLFLKDLEQEQKAKNENTEASENTTTSKPKLKRNISHEKWFDKSVDKNLQKDEQKLVNLRKEFAERRSSTKIKVERAISRLEKKRASVSQGET